MPSENHTSGSAPPVSEPAGAEMHRLHPFTMFQRFVISVPALFVILLPALRNPDAAAWLSIGSLVLYGAFVVPLFVAQYLRFRYAVTPDEIVIHKGVFTFQHRNIPIERIQDIEIEQSLLPRLFGTARVKIETAGSRSVEGVIEFVSLEEARHIRSTVRARQRARRSGAPLPQAGPPEAAPDASRSAEPSVERAVDPSKERAAEPERAADSRVERAVEPDNERAPRAAAERASWIDDTAGELLHRMNLRRVLLSGVFRFSLFYIVAIFSAVEYLGVYPEDIAQWLAGDRFDQIGALMAASPWLVVVTTALMVSLLAWITGIATNLNRFYGFRLGLDEDKLHTRHGLLTVSESTIPLKKVQALMIRTNPLMSAFGWYRLELQTMGFDPNDRGYRVAVPFGRWTDVMQVARTIRPVGDPGSLRSVSRLMIRRTFVRYAVVLAVAAGAGGFVWQPALWSLTALPVLLFVAVQQYRHHGFRIEDDYLYVRRGVFRRNLWILPVDRFQVFYLSQSLFQRRLRLRSVYVDTAGAGVMMHPVIVDLRSDDAIAVLDSIHGHFRARFAGQSPNAAVAPTFQASS